MADARGEERERCIQNGMAKYRLMDTGRDFWRDELRGTGATATLCGKLEGRTLSFL